MLYTYTVCYMIHIEYVWMRVCVDTYSTVIKPKPPPLTHTETHAATSFSVWLETNMPHYRQLTQPNTPIYTHVYLWECVQQNCNTIPVNHSNIDFHFLLGSNAFDWILFLVRLLMV